MNENIRNAVKREISELKEIMNANLGDELKVEPYNAKLNLYKEPEFLVLVYKGIYKSIEYFVLMNIQDGSMIITYNHKGIVNYDFLNELQEYFYDNLDAEMMNKIEYYVYHG